MVEKVNCQIRFAFFFFNKKKKKKDTQIARRAAPAAPRANFAVYLHKPCPQLRIFFTRVAVCWILGGLDFKILANFADKIAAGAAILRAQLAKILKSKPRRIQHTATRPV